MGLVIIFHGVDDSPHGIGLRSASVFDPIGFQLFHLTGG
jgi:hypothetical protein